MKTQAIIDFVIYCTGVFSIVVLLTFAVILIIEFSRSMFLWFRYGNKLLKDAALEFLYAAVCIFAALFIAKVAFA